MSKELTIQEVAEWAWVDYEYSSKRNGTLYSSCYIDGFKAGVEWQAKQIINKDLTVCDLKDELHT